MTTLNPPKYRYIVADLLTDRIIAELPFTSVSYGLALSGAGSFSGTLKFPIQESVTNVYDSTTPGRTALYIMRNDQCVWGGIIWSREYDVIGRVLSISGLEFTSYFSHRKVWKTLGATVGARLIVPDNTNETPYLDPEAGLPFDLKKDQDIRIIFWHPYDNLTAFFKALPDETSDKIYVDLGKFFYRLTYKKVVKVTKEPIEENWVHIELDTSTPHDLKVGDVVTISNTGLDRLVGTVTVTAVLNTTKFKIKILQGGKGTENVDKKAVKLGPDARMTKNGSVPPGTYSVSVDIKPNTYDVIKGIVESTMNDFTGTEFPNEEIEAGYRSYIEISEFECSGGVAYITTNTPHGLSSGQYIEIQNLAASLNGEYQVFDIISDTKFSYLVNSDPVPKTLLETRRINIKSKRTAKKQTLYTFETEHNLAEGDYITIKNVPNQSSQSTKKVKKTKGKRKYYVWETTTTTYTYNGSDVEIIAAPTSQSITVPTSVIYDDIATVDYSGLSSKPYAEITGYVSIASYGPHPDSANLNVTFNESDATSFGLQVESGFSRGFEMLNVSDVLDNYAAGGAGGDEGFDYRIDVIYDKDTNKFTKVFRLIPFFPNGIGVSGDPELLLSELEASKIVFDYPGNISELSISESAEDASTRFFLVGNRADLGEGASQPYSAASLTSYLESGWPLLDASEKAQGSYVYDESLLSAMANSYLLESVPPVGEMTLSVNASIGPEIGSFSVGDWCSIIVNDDFFRLKMQNDSEPRDDVIVRKITSMEVSIEDGSSVPEKLSITLLPIAGELGVAESLSGDVE